MHIVDNTRKNALVCSGSLGGNKMDLIRKLVVAATASVMAFPVFAQEFIAGIPRGEALIIQGSPSQNADWFNVLAAGGGATTNGLQQLSTDTRSEEHTSE